MKTRTCDICGKVILPQVDYFKVTECKHVANRQVYTHVSDMCQDCNNKLTDEVFLNVHKMQAL